MWFEFRSFVFFIFDVFMLSFVIVLCLKVVDSIVAF